MIFLTVGTWRVGYNRLVEAVDELVSSGVITEEVIAQIGYSSYKPKYMTVVKFCSPDKFVGTISKAMIVISHAGMGTIIETIRQRKPIIVVPRHRLLGEADNDHQFTTARQLEIDCKILVAYETSELPEKLKKAKSFIPAEGENCEKILQAVEEFIDNVNVRARKRILSQKFLTRSRKKIWPYKILKLDDEDIKNDLKNIILHFAKNDKIFDMVVFVPYAGLYLSELFTQIYNDTYEVNFMTVRRASTVSKDNYLKKFIFKKEWLSDLIRHLEVLWRLKKHYLKLGQKMVKKSTVDFDVGDKNVLVIDDDVATGMTLSIVKSALLKRGASSVTTASISNHLLPDKIKVDYSVYRYKLLRTKNSRDYYAT